MPNLNWSKLSGLQLGKYAEYYAKMEFTSYGFEVYTSEVDDHGVDFVAKAPNSNDFFEIQVKSVRNYSYTLIKKSKMPILSKNRLICYLYFDDGKLPDVFVIPSTVWENPNAVFVDRNYEKEGQKSVPEWGINISKKNYPLLSDYIIEKAIENIC